MDYYGSRYYDQVAGVFLSADIVHGNSSGANPYAYVGGNPETYSDPTGQMFVPPSGGGSAGGVTGGGGSSSPSSTVQPVNALVPFSGAAQNANSCGKFTQADCTPIKWAALTSLSGNVRVRIPLNIDLGGIVCTGVGPCIVSPFASGASIDINMQVSTTTITPLAGCATISSCFHDAQGVDDKPTDDAGALGFGEGACSFSARTVVATNHGEQAISKVKAGDQTWAYNPETHQMELQPILHVWVHTDHDLVDLTITTIIPARHGNPATRTNEVIHTNQKHPFFTREYGFLPVGKIKVGMHVLRADGTMGVVTGWKVIPGARMMYNLEVARDHTFTVGAGQWVVHNCGGDPPAGWEKLDYGPDNKAEVSDFSHIDEAGNRLEATLYHNSRELQIAWMDSLSQARSHLPDLVNWLGDSVQTVKGYASDNFATYFSPGSRGLTLVNRMFSSVLERSGFTPGTIEPEGNIMWIVFRRLSE